ncbi:MAG TPA: MFS transporter [Aliidongia sp.]|nr:MFS transporter [Aliidongia sp.]
MMPAMPPRPFESIAPVLLGTLSAQLALGVMTPLIPILLLRQGVSTQGIGFVASAYFLGFLAGALRADRIVMRVGHIRAFAVFAAVAADAALFMTLVNSPWSWAVCRFLIGFQMSGLFLVIESWLNDKTDAASRGRTFGIYLLVSWLGAAGGPLLLKALQASDRLFTIGGIAFATALLPMALTPVSNPTIGERSRFGILRLFRISPLGIVCCLTAGLVNSAFWAFIPVYLTETGRDTDDISTFVSIATITGMLVQYPIGLLSDRLGRRPVTLASLLLGLAAALLMGWFSRGSLTELTIIGCLFAGVMAPVYGLGVGQTNDYIAPGDFVGAAGGLLFAWALGASIGPSLAGAVVGMLGATGLFVYLAGMLALVSLFTISRLFLRAGVPRDRQSGFVPAPTAPAGLAELDPRAEPASLSDD